MYTRCKKLLSLGILVLLPFIALTQLKITTIGGAADLNGTVYEVFGLPSDADLKKELYAINQSASDFTVKVRRTEVDVQSGTKNTTCWINCPIFQDAGVNPVLVSSQSATIAASDTNFSFVAHHRPMDLDGCSWMKYEWIDAATESIVYASLDIKFYHSSGNCILGLEDLKNNLFVNLSPNPTSANLLLSLEGISNYDEISVDIFNILGKKVSSISQVGPNNNLNVSDFKNGMYFVSIMKNESLIKTTKLIKE